MKKHGIFLIVFWVGLLISFERGSMANNVKHTDLGLDKVSPEKWDSLAAQGIFFGHQSVGNNIIDGMVDLLKRESGIKINPQEVTSGGDIRSGLFAHARVGKNRSPHSKMVDFTRFIDEGFSNINIAFLKFCYVDVDRDTSVKEMFQEYRSTMENLEKKYPHITFVHFTVPLKVTNDSWRTSLKSLLGRKSWEYADNIRRNEYNQLLKEAFETRAPVFDIALFEAMAADGKFSSFREQGKEYLALQNAYSKDGGHLNDVGRRWIAAHLLVFLAELQP